MSDFVFELTETKWNLLKELEHGSKSPKELAELTQTTIANASQQLKLLEAQGYLKKIKNKGVKSRSEKDARVLYSVAKPRLFVAKISSTRVEKKEIKESESDFVCNLFFCDLKNYFNHAVKFFLNNEALFEKTKSIYYLQTLNDELHFLIITEDLEFFRKDNHTKDVMFNNKKVLVKFWSHSIDEINQGFKKSESYFVDLIKRARPVWVPGSSLTELLRVKNE